MKSFAFIAALAVALSSCATAPKDFYANPSKPKDTSLCRAVMETTDPTFQLDAATELVKRGLTAETCRQKVSSENAAIAGIAIVATGVAVVAACQNGCGGGNSQTVDRDCRGGSGNGPIYVDGPVWVGSYDPYRLDADHDGWGCERSDLGRGA